MTDISTIEESLAPVSMLAQLTEELSALRSVAAHNDAEMAHA